MAVAFEEMKGKTRALIVTDNFFLTMVTLTQ
jgi:hypothetical protein